MSMALWLLGMYCAGCTLIILLLQARSRKGESLDRLVADLRLSDLPVAERVTALATLAKMRQDAIPWYEKGLSTAGIVAFFSMLIATGLQTGKAGVDEIRVEKLRSEMKDLTDRRADLEEELQKVARAAVLQHQEKGGPLDVTSENVLRLRLKSWNPKSKNRDEIMEMYEIALLLRDFRQAVGILEANQTLLDRTEPTDLVSLAEYYFLTGANAAARQCLQEAKPKLSTTPLSVQARAIVVEAAGDASAERYVTSLSGVLRIDEGAARQRLNLDIGRLREAAARLKPN